MYKIVYLLTGVLMIVASQLAYAGAPDESKANSKATNQSSEKISKPEIGKEPGHAVTTKSPKTGIEEEKKEIIKEIREEPKERQKRITHCPDPPCD